MFLRMRVGEGTICGWYECSLYGMVQITAHYFTSFLFILCLQLNFIGVTLKLGCHYIHFTSAKHMFTPIAIGTYNSPKQVSHQKPILFLRLLLICWRCLHYLCSEVGLIQSFCNEWTRIISSGVWGFPLGIW